MASRSNAVYPISTLNEQATALEAAITVCLADPSPKPVHRIRTATRRIEAQLELLDLMAEIPEHKKQAEKLRRQLGKLRRAAGRVRDLDVLCDKLKKPDEEPELWKDAGGKQLQKESRQLGKHFKEQRVTETNALVSLLTKAQGKVVRALEDLLEVLAPAELLIEEANLIELSLGWFAARVAAPSGERGEEALHDARKAAKLVRYVLESAPKSAQKAKRLAGEFEALQQSGGEWHDLLTLAAEARKGLGKKSELAARVGKLRDASLVEFMGALATSLSTPHKSAGTKK